MNRGRRIDELIIINKMEDMQVFKSCSFCNLFSAIQCMMQELKEDHVRKSHSLEKSNIVCTKSVNKQNVENEKVSLKVVGTMPVAEVSLNSEKIKERSDGYFKDDSADDKSKHVNDATHYDIGVGTMNDYNEAPMDIDDNLKFTNDTTINDNSYNFDEFIFNVNETTMNVEDKNESIDIEQDNLNNVSVDDESTNNEFNANRQEGLAIRLSNESKIWNHFQIKQDTMVEAGCIYCGKILKRKAGKTSSFLNHLRINHQDKLPVKNESIDIDQDILKNVSVEDESTNNEFNADMQEDLEIRLSNKSKIWNHFQIKQDTKVEAECIYCGKVLKRRAGKTSSFLNHLRSNHQDKLPVKLHKRKFNRSVAWNHFKRVPSNNARAECKYCGKWISKIHGSTSSMIRHLINHHQLVNIQSIEKDKPTQDQVFSECLKSESIDTDRPSSSSSIETEEVLIDMLIDEKGTFNNYEENYSSVVTSGYIETVDQESIADGEDSNFDNKYKEFSATTEISVEKYTDSDDDRKYTSDDTSKDTKDTKYNHTESNYNNYNTAPMNDDTNVTMNDNDVDNALTVFDTKESLQCKDDLAIQSDVWNHFKIKPNSTDEAECNYCDKVLNFCDDMTGSLIYHFKHKHNNGQKIIRTRVKKSLVWDHCKLLPNSDKVECNYCNMTYSTSHGSTSNMKRHLENKHPQKLMNQKDGQKIYRKGSKLSILLDNFKPQPDTLRKTECKYCGIWISNSNGSTTRMLKHLRNKHEELMKSQTNEGEINDKKSNRSLVWDYFKPPEKGNSVRKCSYCGELFSNPDGNKTDMIKHLQVKHPNKIQAFSEETEENYKSKEDTKIYNNIKMEEINRPANSIWEHFRFQDNSKDQVQCKYCNNCEKPSTMISHLRKNHPTVMKTFTGIKQ